VIKTRFSLRTCKLFLNLCATANVLSRFELKCIDINSIKIQEVWQQQKSLVKPCYANVSLPECRSLDTQQSYLAGPPTFILGAAGKIPTILSVLFRSFPYFPRKTTETVLKLSHDRYSSESIQFIIPTHPNTEPMEGVPKMARGRFP
jgi:hypothetical protein